MRYHFPYVGADLSDLRYLVLNQTPANTARLRIRASVSRDVPVYSPAFAEYSFLIPTEGWLRLSRPGCLFLRRDGLPVLRRSPIQELTGPEVE